MKTLILSFLALIVFSATNAQTTTANASQTVTLNLQNQIDISVVTATGTSFVFDSPTDYSAGITNLNASQFQVRSNKPWAVTVAAATATFSSSSTTAMPANKLGVRLASGTTYSQLATTAANLASGARGTGTFTVDYNANPGFSYDAAAYTLSVVYTATQQ